MLLPVFVNMYEVVKGNPVYVANISDDPAMYEDYAERDRVKFKAADENNDGKLSKEEFPFFMYPEQHEFMAKHVVGVSVTVTEYGYSRLYNIT